MNSDDTITHFLHADRVPGLPPDNFRSIIGPWPRARAAR